MNQAIEQHHVAIVEQRDARIRDLERLLKASQNGHEHALQEARQAEKEVQDLEKRLRRAEAAVAELESKTRAYKEMTEEAAIHLEEYAAFEKSNGPATLRDVKQWCRAYPVAMFAEPNWTRAAQALKDAGESLDAISASNMRHVCRGITAIIDAWEEKESQREAR